MLELLSAPWRTGDARQTLRPSQGLPSTAKSAPGAKDTLAGPLLTMTLAVVVGWAPTSLSALTLTI